MLASYYSPYSKNVAVCSILLHLVLPNSTQSFVYLQQFVNTLQNTPDFLTLKEPYDSACLAFFISLLGRTIY